jgi:hypothetical protein
MFPMGVQPASEADGFRCVRKQAGRGIVPRPPKKQPDRRP